MKNKLLLSIALTAAALGAVTLLDAQATLNRGGQHLEGAWIGDAGAQKILLTFSTDGSVFSSSPTGAVGPQGAQLLTAGHGSWIRTGDREFAVTTLNMHNDPGAVSTGLSKARYSFKLSDTLDELTGPYKTDILGADGNVIFSLTGQVRLKRIAVEPLDE